MSACQGTGALASRTRQKSKPQQEHGLPLQGQSDETTRAFWQTARPPRVAAALGQGKELRRHPLPPPPPPTPRAEVRNNRARRWWQSASRTCGQAAVQKRREKQSAPRGVAASAWSPGGGGAYHSTTTPIPCPPHPSLPPPPLRPAVATRASCVGTCCVPCDAAAKRRPEASPDATHAIARQHSADALAAGKAGRDGG